MSKRGASLRMLLQRLSGRSRQAGTKAVGDQKDKQGCVSPYLPPGRRLYCIGDIHGRLDLLEELHGMITQDSAEFDGSKAVVYLGDYIDRGAQSKQVLDLLVEQPLSGFEAIFLMGNHEQAMLDFLKHPRESAAWLTFGGQVTLLSYGIAPGKLMMSQDVEVLRDELEEKLPQSHLDLMNSCRLLYTEGSYCFTHAGIRPGVPVADQVAQDVLWIREEFTRNRDRHEYIVVHGHTISDEVDWKPNRVGIDTGAFRSGLLTTLVLEGEDQRLLQTGRSASG